MLLLGGWQRQPLLLVPAATFFELALELPRCCQLGRALHQLPQHGHAAHLCGPLYQPSAEQREPRRGTTVALIVAIANTVAIDRFGNDGGHMVGVRARRQPHAHVNARGAPLPTLDGQRQTLGERCSVGDGERCAAADGIDCRELLTQGIPVGLRLGQCRLWHRRVEHARSALRERRQRREGVRARRVRGERGALERLSERLRNRALRPACGDQCRLGVLVFLRVLGRLLRPLLRLRLLLRGPRRRRRRCYAEPLPDDGGAWRRRHGLRPLRCEVWRQLVVRRVHDQPVERALHAASALLIEALRRV